MDKTRDSTNSKIWPDSTCAISFRRKGQILLVVESLVLSTTSTEQCFGKILEDKKANFFSSTNPLTFSKLKSKEFVKDFFNQKVSRFMHAWFTLKGKVEKIRCWPVYQMKLLAMQ